MAADEVLHSLIQLIYEAALDPEKWPNFLSKWGSALGAQSTGIAVHDPIGRQSSIEATAEFDPECLRVYQAHYAPINEWLTRGGHLFQPGMVVNGDAILSPRQLARTEFYADWLRPYGYLHSHGGAITRQDGIFSYITAMRSQQAGPFEEEDLMVLRVLMPHLECAARLHLRVADLRGRLAATSEALDLMGRSVVFTDSDARILLMNAPAEKLLSHSDGITCSKGHLTASETSESRKLKRMIASAAAAAENRTMQPGGVVAISRPSGKRPLEAFISPLRNRSVVWLKVSAVLVIVTNPEDSGELSHEALKDLFGLTPAEARLAQALAAGTRLAQAANCFGISTETIRTQLKSIFLKTGTNRQSDLARLLSVSSARLHRGKKCE